MNEIIIITTEGCEGCRIAINLVEDALKYINDSIRVVIFDYKDERAYNFTTKFAISDFPAILFIKCDVVEYIHIGTMPVPQILHNIKLWFRRV